MKKKTKMRLLSILLCFVMLIGLMPTTAFAAGTKLETPQNLKLQGTMLSWDAVDNADFYGITLYHPNYQYSIGSWQTDGTNINLYKYLKDGETYGATVIACSNGSYQISTPAQIPLTACTNAGVPIYRDVNVVNGTSSNATAYPGMSVRLEAKPAPDGMVFDRWELSGGYINIGYSDTDTVIYVQAICDNDISARATYKYQENVTSAFTVQPQGGAALVGESFNVTYAMNFTPQGTVKVQVEGNTPGSFTDLKQGTIDSASVQENSVVTKTFRIMAYDGTRNIYSDEFVVSWEDGPRFISQPVGGTVGHNVDFIATYALNFTPFSCRVERYNDYLGQWSELSFASATQATISSYDFNTTNNYRIKAIIEGGGEVYSDEFTVTWSDAVSKFIQHPVGGTVGLDEDFSFTFAINFTPVSNVAIQKYNSGFDSWDTVNYCASLASGTISGFASETTNKYRLEAYENGNPIRSNEFIVTWEGADYTVSFAANGGSGTMADVNNVSGEYTLPACGFTAPNGQRFKAWLVNGNQKAVGDKITVSANTVVTAIWENIPEYIVSYNANGGSGTMVGDMVEGNGKFTLENCTYIAPEGYKFKAWAIGSVNGEQKKPGEQITITGETYIYAIWESIAVSNYTITATAGENGNITPSGEVSVAKGSSKTFTITADNGYQIKDVKVNGTSIGAVSAYTFENVLDNATISVEFDVDTVLHTCNPNLVPKVEPNCTTAGKSAYYHCECGKNYEDAQGNTEIADIETWGILNPLDHNYASAWSSDASGHWKICTRCSEKQNVSAHSAGDWIVDKEATETAVGSKHKECSVCGYKLETAEIPQTGKQKEPTPVPAAKGKVITDEQGGSYKVIKSDAKDGEVTYAKPKSGVKGTVKIPDTVTVDGITYKVTAIEADAFKNNKNITKVIIGNNVTVIGKNAFAGCKKLSSVTVGKKVKTISAGAFSGCTKLKTVKLGSAVTTIGDKAFYKCTSLTSITIPSKVTKIGKSAFEGCKKLKRITVKSTKLKSVGKKALKGIHTKAKIKVPKSKLAKYKRLFKNKGQGKNVKVIK